MNKATKIVLAGVVAFLLLIVIVNYVGDRKSEGDFPTDLGLAVAAVQADTPQRARVTKASVIDHTKRIARAANRRHHGDRVIIPGPYSRAERRVIRHRHLRIPPRQMLLHPHRYINDNDVRRVTQTRYANALRQHCMALVDERKVESMIFHEDLWTFRTRFDWCWRGDRIVEHEGHLQTTQVDDAVVQLNGIIENNDQYWVGSQHELFVFNRLYSASNCVFRYGCWKSWSPTYQVVVAAGGAWNGEFWWA
jgi:hypothetical protein